MKEVILKPPEGNFIYMDAAFERFMADHLQLISYRDGVYYILKEVSDGVFKWLSLTNSRNYRSCLDTETCQKSVLEWFRRTMCDMEKVWLLEEPEDLAKIFK